MIALVFAKPCSCETLMCRSFLMGGKVRKIMMVVKLTTVHYAQATNRLALVSKFTYFRSYALHKFSKAKIHAFS